MNKKVKGALIIISSLVVVFVATAFFVSNGKATKEKQVYTVKQNNVNSSIITSGSVISPKSVLIKSELVGRIVSSELEEGDMVEKDIIIAHFDDSELSSSLKQAEISLLNAKNQLETIKSKDIKDAKEQLNQAEYEYANSSIEYERAKKLFDSGIPIDDSNENLFRALINEPEIIFADEPTGNLDSESTEQVYNLMRSINKELGTTFVIVTHDRHLAAKSDRIIEILDGNIERDFKTSSQDKDSVWDEIRPCNCMYRNNKEMAKNP